ncbi:CRISP/Allergen/PR-1-like [Penaeus indicus]|uniref:CRISP/Allergen/PR-1-like n=1 Tax=Penaeus indicus TaxID=29960 RepID=UPI00300C4087
MHLQPDGAITFVHNRERLPRPSLPGPCTDSGCLFTMIQRLCLLLTITAWAGWAAGQSPYCSFTPEHTLCGASGLGPTCGSQVPGRGVSAQDAALIVAQHNQLRSRVAMGQEGRGAPGPQPQAANMRLMEWDDELALVAQGHADQCILEHECSDCRRVRRFGVGQNLHISLQSNFDNSIEWEDAIQAWYDEVGDFNSSDVEPFRILYINHIVECEM